MRTRLLQAGIAINSINRILKRSLAPDLTDALRDQWSAIWDGANLANFALLLDADQMDRVVAIEKQFLQQTMLDRVVHAATQPMNSSQHHDLRWAGIVALDNLPDLVGFREEVLKRTVKLNGKVGYSVLTDIDIELRQALIEVTTQLKAKKKIAQLQRYLDPISNPFQKPVLQFMPMFADVDPNRNGSVKALLDAGSSGVFNDLSILKTALAKL